MFRSDPFGDLKDSDFNVPTPVKYDSKNDYISKGSSKLFSHLDDESLFRYSKDEREELENKGSGLDKFMSRCYLSSFKEAFEMADTLYLQYKENPIYWNTMGICYFLQGNQRKAQLFFNKALGKDKDYAPAMNNLGVLYRKNGEDQKALEAFKTARQYNKFSKTPKFNIAQLYLEYGLASKALQEFYRMKKLDPNDVDVTVALATALLMQGKYALAVNEYQSIDSDFYERDDIGINYAYALYLIGKKDKAEDIIDDVKLKNPKLGAYYNKIKALVR